MNLVKVAEELKGVPMQALQAYMNGTNPDIPPYVAQGEMMRRQKMMQQAQMAQGAQNAQQPSVKEQLEQTAGLMALQQQRAQQASQQMGQQSTAQPMPANEGLPEPRRQPESGITGLPVPDNMFEMASGGVVGYQAGGDVQDLHAKMQELQASKRKYRTSPDALRMIDDAIAEVEAKLQAALGTKPEREAAPPELMLSAPGPGGRERPPRPPALGKAPPAQLPGDMGNMPTATPPAPKTGLPAAQQQSADQMSADLLKQIEGMKGPTADLAEIGRQERQLQEQSGIAGLSAQRDKMRAGREEMLKGRGLETFIATMAGGARGYGGTAAGYLDALRTQRSADAAFDQQMYGLEAEQAERSYTTQSQMLKEAQARADEWARKQREMGIEVKKADIEARRAQELERLKQENQLELEGVRGKTQRDVANIYASRSGGAGGSGSAAYDRAVEKAEQAFSRDPRALALKKQMESIVVARNPQRMADLTSKLEAIRQEKYREFGVTMADARGTEGTRATEATNDPLGIR